MLNKFNITPSTLRGRIQDLQINDETSPSSADVIEMISGAAAEVAREASYVGLDTSAFDDSDDPSYLLFREMIIEFSLYKILRSRDRGGLDGAKPFMDEYHRLLGILKKQTTVFQKPETDTMSKRPQFKSKEQLLGNWLHTGAGMVWRQRR